MSVTVVLIVEDDTLLRMLTVDVVEEAGFEAIEAADADAAISLLECRPDIVLFENLLAPSELAALYRSANAFVCPNNDIADRLVVPEDGALVGRI